MTPKGSSSWKNRRVHLVGVKGTGMAALAEILHSWGALLTGSDTAERFYTDEILEAIGIPVREGFDASNVPAEVDLVIHSTAYDPGTHAELVEARNRGVPIRTYPQALGLVSGEFPFVAISGVHGKTTTAALCAAIVSRSGLPGTVLAGSSLPDLGGRATLVAGEEFFIAETCEYRRAFLNVDPAVVVVTSIEHDHPDYFADTAEVLRAFQELVDRLPDAGELVYCADDPGAIELARWTEENRPDVLQVPYGESAPGEGRVVFNQSPAGRIRFTVGRRPFELRIPGRHNAMNAAAAFIAVDRIRRHVHNEPDAGFAALAREAVSGFKGTKRRSELVGEVGGITVMDDYGHHPTAILTTLEGYREFYPNRRIVLDFMPHTYSRTRALLERFANALAEPDVTILHEIYASARESNPGDVSGESLADSVRDVSAHPQSVHYVSEVADALPLILATVRSGDLFVTMGAGNNWQLGRLLLDALERQDVTV